MLYGMRSPYRERMFRLDAMQRRACKKPPYSSSFSFFEEAASLTIGCEPQYSSMVSSKPRSAGASPVKEGDAPCFPSGPGLPLYQFVLQW